MATTVRFDDLSELLDPTQAPVEITVRPAPALPDLAGRHIGFLDNSKPRSDELLRAIGAALANAYHCTWELCAKPDSRTILPALREEMSTRFHAVVTGVGD